MTCGRITVLVENTAGGRGVLAEHGLSFWVEIGSRRILFDAGQTNVLLHNAHVLGIDLSTLDAIVLSHGHYDHVGGLQQILDIAPSVPVYLHPQAIETKFACSGKQAREIGMDRDAAQVLEQHIHNGLGSFTNARTEVFPGVWATGEIPRRSAFEDIGGRFYKDSDCTRPDELSDDQALVLEVGNDLVVVLGCAHSGVINTLDHVAELFPGRPVRMLLGGMHLGSASHMRIAKTIETIRRYNVRRIGPAHCTGGQASRELWSTLPERCFVCNTGTQIML
jgi:7,8-dihydropterin-6-yl-methyl-4-(beta-D-ribofuranosyl)aminobenzene 5'-phosphate synthase